MSSSEQGAPPAPEVREEKKSSQTFEQWRIIINRVRPQLLNVTILTLGLIIGLLWAYAVAPVVWTNADPVHLHPSHQDEWVKMTADQYALFGPQVSEHTQSLLAQVGNSQAIIDRLIAANPDNLELVGRLQSIQPLASGPDNPELQKLQTGGLQALNPIILVLLVWLLGCFFIIFWGMYGLTATLIVKGLLPRRHKTPKDEKASEREAELRRIHQEAAPPAPATAQEGPPPVAQFVSAYLTGDDYYDDSFSIEDASGGFLGETGAGISETIGVGAPKKVAAVEIWLFDKNDIRTITKVIMSEHAYNDEALRAKMAPKGDAVMAKPGLPVELETQTLRIIATIRNLQYGEGALPANSHFDNLTLDIAAYAKEGATSAPGTAISDMYNQGNVSSPPPPSPPVG
ncbi:hypothetical protein ACFLYO_01040 [Chloroflexota bacterium]